jgi:Peptidase MA superfamily
VGSVTRRPRPVSRPAALASALLLAIGWSWAASPVAAADVEFGQPTATALVGQAAVFRTTFVSQLETLRVELLTRIPRARGSVVQEAAVSGRSGEEQTASLLLEESLVPNTTILYRFRVVTATAAYLGPEAQVTVSDDRFDWQTLEGDFVRLHWYEGGDAFGQRALQIGDDAVRDVSQLLGVTESEPLDFFVYADQTAFYDAMGPGTRENVGGQAHADIRTMFGLIEPNEIDSAWVEVVIPHELTHLVFDTAVKNPYHFPPRWLNEGIAVYLSEGYAADHRFRVEEARDQDRLIPLDGLAGQFPTSRDAFFLAYGESVSAVDYFIRTHGQDTLVQLVRSYGDGVSDDEAFEAAIGIDTAEFNEAWLADLGADSPRAFGPRPVEPGALPEGWSPPSGEVPPGSVPDDGAVPSDPAGPPDNGGGSFEFGDELDPAMILLLLAVTIAGAVVLAVLSTPRPRPRA